MTLCYRSPHHYIPDVSALWIDERLEVFIFLLSIFLLENLNLQSSKFVDF